MAHNKNINPSSRISLTYMLALCLPVTVACVDVMAVSVALSQIMNDLSSTLYATQWLLSGYTIGTAAFLITIGRLADIYGRKQLLIIGICLFAFSSLVAALSLGIYCLMASRFVQGVASSIMMTTVMSIITNEFSPRNRGRVIATYGFFLGLGLASGPAVGGLLISYFNWRAIFLVNLPICMLSLWLVMNYLPKSSRSGNYQRVDWLETTVLTLLLLAAVIMISQGSMIDWQSPLMIALCIVFVLLLVLFIKLEKNKPDPMVDISLFMQPNYLGATICGLLSYFCMYAWLCVIGLYLQNIDHYTALKTGLICTPFSLAFAFSSKALSGLINRYANKTLMQIGFIVIIIALGWMANITPLTNQFLLLIEFFLFGVGITIVNATSMIAATEHVPLDKAGIASGLIFTIRWLGGSVGIVIVSFFYHRYSESLFYPCMVMLLAALTGLLMTLTLSKSRVSYE